MLPSGLPCACAVRDQDVQVHGDPRRCPPHRGQTLWTCVNNTLSPRLAGPGFGAILPSVSNGVCPPEVCVASAEKLAQMSLFFFFVRVAGCTITWPLEADFPVSNPRGAGCNLC